MLPYCLHLDQLVWTLLVQEGRRGFMAGVAELKAGPTQEQQQHARLLRERLQADLQEQVPICHCTCYIPCCN